MLDISCDMKVILVVIFVLFVMWLMFPKFEGFDKTGTELTDVFEPNYDLRGVRIKGACALDNYMKYRQNIVLNTKGGMEYTTSNKSPIEEGKQGNYKKIACPSETDGQWKDNVCWIRESNPYDVKIPLIHPHVMN